MSGGGAPYHAHIYYTDEERPAAEAVRAEFNRQLTASGDRRVLFVGQMTDREAGPHPIPQFEIHFLEASLPTVRKTIERAGLKALVHPLTDNDLADHTTLAQWIGEPLQLDFSVLDPPGTNQGVARFGKTEF